MDILLEIKSSKITWVKLLSQGISTLLISSGNINFKKYQPHNPAQNFKILIITSAMQTLLSINLKYFCIKI